MILRKHPHVLIACMNKNNSSAYYCLWWLLALMSNGNTSQLSKTNLLL
jgi:hypothetical protein